MPSACQYHLSIRAFNIFVIWSITTMHQTSWRGKPLRTSQNRTIDINSDVFFVQCQRTPCLWVGFEDTILLKYCANRRMIYCLVLGHACWFLAWHCLWNWLLVR